MSQGGPTVWHARWWATSVAGQEGRRWAFYSIGAQMCAVDTGKVHGPAVSVRHERATRPGMDARRGLAADRAYRTLLFMGADVAWRRVYDTGKVHGCSLPTATDLYWAEHDRFARGDGSLLNRYRGPWVRHSGARSYA